MKRSGPLPQTNEELEAVSSFNKKEAAFPPLFNLINEQGSELWSPFWERPARSALFIQF
jgi:hypothetical protein